MNLQAPLDQRLWRRVRKGGGCWEWTGARDHSGYGLIGTGLKREGNRRVDRTHRIAWALTNGPIPSGLKVLHRCDNPPCVRPEHLFLGSDTVNARDREGKVRGGNNVKVKINGRLMNKSQASRFLGFSRNTLGMRQKRWGLGLALAMLIGGCAHAPTGNPREYVAAEPVGGVVARILTGASNSPVDAVTIGKRTVYLRNVDDSCLRAHEAVHREQERDPGFYRAYLDELVRHGYDGNGFELAARAAQEACESRPEPARTL